MRKVGKLKQQFTYWFYIGLCIVSGALSFSFFFLGVCLHWIGFHNVDLAVNALAFALYTDTPPEVYLKWRDSMLDENNTSLSYPRLYGEGVRQLDLSMMSLVISTLTAIMSLCSHMEASLLENRLRRWKVVRL